jgi:hypothetical protein
MANRTPRSIDTRETGERKKPWKRSSMLPTPEDRTGLKYRWIRTATLGNADMTNVSARFREGYTPVKAEDYPELQIMSDIDSRFKDNMKLVVYYFVVFQKKKCLIVLRVNWGLHKISLTLLIGISCGNLIHVCQFFLQNALRAHRLVGNQ